MMSTLRPSLAKSCARLYTTVVLPSPLTALHTMSALWPFSLMLRSILTETALKASLYVLSFISSKLGVLDTPRLRFLTLMLGSAPRNLILLTRLRSSFDMTVVLVAP